MSTSLHDAISRAASHLASLATVETVLADVRADVIERDFMRSVAEAVEAGQRGDGSWVGSLMETSLALNLLHELRRDRNNAIDNAIEWIKGRRGAPGHIAPAFFSPAPPSVDLGSMTLPGGAAIGSDADVRIAISCVACESIVVWGESDAQVELHLRGAAELVQQAISGRFALSLPALLCATRLFCAADYAAPTRSAALEFVARSQRGDGSWRGADLFLVLDVLGTSCRLGMAPPAVMVALRHAADMLFLMQQPDGSWGRQTGPVQMLAGLSALRALQHEARTAQLLPQRLPQRTPTDISPPIIL